MSKDLYLQVYSIYSKSHICFWKSEAKVQFVCASHTHNDWQLLCVCTNSALKKQLGLHQLQLWQAFGESYVTSEVSQGAAGRITL